VRRASAERVSAGRGVAAAVVAVEAGVEATTGAGAGAGAGTTGTTTAEAEAGVLAADFLGAAGMFVVLEELVRGISNAGYTLYPPDLFKSQAVEGTHNYETKMVRIRHVV